MLVCGLPAGLSRAASSHGRQVVQGVRTRPPPRMGRRGPARQPGGLVTVLFQPGCLAAPKIHGLLVSTSLRSGSSQGGHVTLRRCSFGEEILDGCSHGPGNHRGLCPCVRFLDIHGRRPCNHDRPYDHGRQSKPDADRNCGRLVHAQDDCAFQLCLDRRGQRPLERPPCSNAIDGKEGTFWHSGSSSLPHHITINLHATRYVSALTYLPRQDTSSNGNIGRYSISVSMNGTTWGAPVVTGTWADDKSRKTAAFSTVSPGTSG
jgi:F5/8 type C domain